MHLRLTVVGPRSGTDVVVEADPGSPAGAAVPGLLDAVGLPPGTAVTCQGRVVDDHLVLGLPPLVDGAVVRAGGAAATTRDRPPGVVEVRVVGGPGAGGVHRVGHGTYTVGRAAGCAVRVDDPALSREHARVVVGDHGVAVEDAGSTNGTVVDAAGGAAVRARLGGTTLLIQPPLPGEPAAARPQGDGTVAVSRSPRRPPQVPGPCVPCPSPPVRREPARVPWLAALLPLVVTVPLVALWGPVALVFGLTSPVLVLGAAWADRRASAADHARELDEHEARLEEVRQRFEAALADERAARHDAAPDAASVAELARGPHRGLWCRAPSDDDHLVLRLGLGRLRSSTRVERHAGTGGHPVGAGRGWLDSLADDGSAPLDDVPLTVRLADVGALGLSGAPHAVAGLLRHLLTQLAVLHSPRDVRVAVVADGSSGDDWGWTRWLPHTTAADDAPAPAVAGVPGALVATGTADAGALVAELATMVRRRRGEPPTATGTPWSGPWLVALLVDGAEPGRYPGLSTVLEDGPAVGVLTVCAAGTEAGLPSACGAVATLSDPGRTPDGPGRSADGGAAHDLAVRLRDGSVLTGVADRVAQPWAHDVGRCLAPLRDAGGSAAAGGALPSRVRLADLLDTGPAPDGRAIRDRWQARPRETAAVLGAAPAGRWVVDLRTDGPHVLVAGTTGAGKSELLRTLVTSLAWGNRPDELQLVLVDFKGGAAFAECADLPHTAGLVTDLDRHLTERVLTSLRAEITRRERLLAAHGAADLDAYLPAIDAGRAPRLPRLVVVIDEFRALAEELPDLLGGLVRLAAVGRSLGLHLVLATQRPGGVVGPDLRANVNLRIALRVRDAGDAHDVVESAAAARISATTPGRAVVRTGAEPLLEVQAASVSGTARSARPVRVHRVAPGGSALAYQAPTQEVERPQPEPAGDLSLLVAALREASAGIPAARSPWLPPLPDVLLPPAGDADDVPVVPVGILLLGLADLPAEQAQLPSVWDLARDGCLLVVGATGSGRTGVLRALASEVARRPPDRVHLHVLDGDGGLRDLAALPHAGTVVDRADPDRAVRLLELLAAEVTRRRTLDGADLRELPWVVVLVDAADTLLADLEAHAAGRGADLLWEVVRAGPGARVVTCVAGGRALLGHRIGTSTAERLVLRMADPADQLLAGVPAALAGGARPPGRAVRLGATPAHEVQVTRVVAAATAEPAPAGAADAGARRPAPTVRSGIDAPLHVPAMPVTVSLDDLTDGLAEEISTDPFDGGVRGPARAVGSPGRVTVGVGGDDVLPLSLDLRAACALVSGPPGSGRSTALRTVAAGLVAAGHRVVAVAPRGGPLAAPSGPAAADTAEGTLTTTDGRDTERVRELLRTADAVLVDDPDALAGTPAEALLLAFADGVADRGRALVVAGSPTLVTAHPAGLAAAARRSRQGLVLRPEGYADGDVLGVTLPRGAPTRPGRGYLVRDGRTVRIQVATPPRRPPTRRLPEPGAHGETGHRAGTGHQAGTGGGTADEVLSVITEA